MGSSIDLEVINEVSQSRLTRLWNESALKREGDDGFNSIVDKVSKVFTVVVIVIAVAAGFWYVAKEQLPTALNAFTAVLIITCPCALALSYPFALGNSIRILGRNKLFLKNTRTIEKMSSISDVVFDKTGTITISGSSGIEYHGNGLSVRDRKALYALSSQSGHPLSKMVSSYLKDSGTFLVKDFHEFAGKGLKGVVDGTNYAMGSLSFVDLKSEVANDDGTQTRVYWSKDGVVQGHFAFNNVYRPFIGAITSGLFERNMILHLVSGDNDSERSNLSAYFNGTDRLHFRQSPANKLEFVKGLQHSGASVMMLGDGLNDAGALIQSDCGVAVSDNINNFSPACDAILDASAFDKLPRFIDFSKRSMKVIYASYVISLLYNTVGIWFAVQGNLSPLFAANIMPLSTVTIILFTTLGSGWMAWRSEITR
jgi:Cu+-exporting ATPase